MLTNDVQKSKQNFATKSNFFNQLSYMIDVKLKQLNTLKNMHSYSISYNYKDNRR